jgi:predicted Zn-dependent peptidase
MVVAVSGDVNPKEIKKLAETYFGRLPKGNPAPELMIKEPKQRGERRFVIREQSQPWFITGYHTVSNKHEDADALELLGSILSGGRTSRLYKRMVEEEASALSVGALNGFPGDKYDSMFLTFVIPNQGVELDKIESTLDEEIEKVKNGEITEEELERVKTQARASLIRNLDSNMGLALQLSQAQAQHGDWRKVFTGLDDLESVTLDDIQRVANTYLVKTNRTVGMIVNEAPKTASAQ